MKLYVLLLSHCFTIIRETQKNSLNYFVLCFSFVIILQVEYKKKLISDTEKIIKS